MFLVPAASPLIRDMLTVDPLKRADIAYICDHPWVHTIISAICLTRRADFFTLRTVITIYTRIYFWIETGPACFV